jgi:hypothetical protein
MAWCRIERKVSFEASGLRAFSPLATRINTDTSPTNLSRIQVSGRMRKLSCKKGALLPLLTNNTKMGRKNLPIKGIFFAAVRFSNSVKPKINAGIEISTK